MEQLRRLLNSTAQSSFKLNLEIWQADAVSDNGQLYISTNCFSEWWYLSSITQLYGQLVKNNDEVDLGLNVSIFEKDS